MKKYKTGSYVRIFITGEGLSAGNSYESFGKIVNHFDNNICEINLTHDRFGKPFSQKTENIFIDAYYVSDPKNYLDLKIVELNKNLKQLLELSELVSSND